MIRSKNIELTFTYIRINNNAKLHNYACYQKPSRNQKLHTKKFKNSASDMNKGNVQGQFKTYHETSMLINSTRIQDK